MEKRVLIAALGVIALWSSIYVGIRLSVSSYTPGHLALFRYAIASATLAIFGYRYKISMPKPKDIPGIIATGFLGISLYSVILNYGEIRASAGAASFIVASAPVFVAIFARLFLKERLNLVGWLGIVLSLLGIGLVSEGESGGILFDWSSLVMAIAPVIIALFFVFQKSFLKRYTVVEFTMYSFWTGTLFLLYFAPRMIRQIETAPVPATVSIIYLGVLPSAIGYMLWAYVLSQVEASKASSFIYLQPIVTLPIAWLWIHESPSSYTIIGGIITLMGVVIVNTYGKVGGVLREYGTQENADRMT